MVLNSETDPYFNLAAEEFLLREKAEDIFMLWRNQKAVVVGKHQNTMAEVNIGFVLENNIPVLRRLSGGGTVFHDPGNINFTFISNARPGEEVKIDFRRFLDPVIQVLAGFGVRAEYNGRNDLLVDGMKMSGNAEHIYHRKKRTLHHGTLLYNSRLEDLSGALRVNALKYRDKAVKSVRSKVCNISTYMDKPLPAELFFEALNSRMAVQLRESTFYSFNASDKLEIERLATEKYRQWDWNFGYSPKYSFNRQTESPYGETEVRLEAEKGLIVSIDLQAAGLSPEAIEGIAAALKGCRHFPPDVLRVLETLAAEKPDWQLDAAGLGSAFF